VLRLALGACLDLGKPDLIVVHMPDLLAALGARADGIDKSVLTGRPSAGTVRRGGGAESVLESAKLSHRFPCADGAKRVKTAWSVRAGKLPKDSAIVLFLAELALAKATTSTGAA
jgi:hypothetical protein